MTRTASEVGAGLAGARPARAIVPGERIHVVGIAGAGASAAALLAHHAGAIVSGCDIGGPSVYTAALDAVGIVTVSGHDAAHVTTGPRPDRLAVTKALTAIAPDHPELVAARHGGVPVEPWQQVVADAAAGQQLVAVAGTHGKSTTSGWLVSLLVDAGRDPSAFVGALLPGAITGTDIAATARHGTGPLFVVEADEYADNFAPYRPDVAVLTGVEWDHPDVFDDAGAVRDAFVRWLLDAPAGSTVVANVGDPGGAAVVEALAGQDRRFVVTILVDDEDASTRVATLEEGYRRMLRSVQVVAGRITDTDRESTTVEVVGLGPDVVPQRVRLQSAGRHNAVNALCVAGAAVALGVAPDAIVEGLGAFRGVGRRLERKGEAAGVVIYDDYGHHPTAIRATIDAVRQREPGRRVWAVYEPLTYHRTAALLTEFAEALATADAVAIADIWAGRDPDTTIASADGLARAVTTIRPGIEATAPGSVEATADHLANVVRPSDAVLVMGGGHSHHIAERLLERLEAR